MKKNYLCPASLQWHDRNGFNFCTDTANRVPAPVPVQRVTM